MIVISFTPSYSLLAYLFQTLGTVFLLNFNTLVCIDLINPIGFFFSGRKILLYILIPYARYLCKIIIPM